ncbi:MAG: tetratricopeptide repeat protein [Helicobacter sp.]|nr:tetratricopeptide repeat protein [Helicobacter sp.]
MPDNTPNTQNNQIIQLDDNFDILQDVLKNKKEPQEPQKPSNPLDKLLDFFNKHKKISILAFFLLPIFLLALIFAIAHLFKEEKIQQPPPLTAQESPAFNIEKGGDLITDAHSLDALIQKANFLYTSGNKVEALDLFGKISNYSEGLSNYNLGVAQMREKSYQEALKSFQRAIDLGEDRVISSLNAAVCSLYLGNNLQFQYYITLAQAYLPYAGNLPLYSYLYGLADYYQGNYIEALSPLLRRNSEYYQKENDYLLASLYSYFNNDYQAIDYLSRYGEEPQNWLNLGLLYARIGDYVRADNLLQQNIQAYGENIQSDIALELVKIKLSQFENAGKILEKYANNQEDIDKNPYPIRITLKDKFFDINLAQKRFWDNFNNSRLNSYKLIFYFAPYQVFDAKEAFNIIQEGGLNIHIENLQEAKEILLRGQTISRVNRNIANAVLESLNGNIRNANTLLENAVKSYPNHSILHYNLGLNYAQMGEYDNAYHHFLRSFHLNPKDLKAGIFALIAGNLTHRDNQRLISDIGREVANIQNDPAEENFILGLLSFARDGNPQLTDWNLLESNKTAVYYALEFAKNVVLGDQSGLIRSANALKELLPNDPITNMLALLALNYKDNPKELSLKLQGYYQDKNINKEGIYYGPAIVREFYIEMAHIIGTLHYVQQDLDFRLISEQKDPRGVIQALALTYLYLQEFEKSFTLYNSLIDDFKEDDTQTYFLASVAAIGANHTENAAALLQLSKLESPTNYDTKIAIGLLHQQEKNFHAASTQFTTIGNSGTSSEYFDFKIDTTELLKRINMN